jgi:hypothetical protein
LDNSDIEDQNDWLDEAGIPVTVDEEEISRMETPFKDYTYPPDTNPFSGAEFSEAIVNNIEKQQESGFNLKVPDVTIEGVLWDQLSDPPSLPFSLDTTDGVGFSEVYDSVSIGQTGFFFGSCSLIAPAWVYTQDSDATGGAVNQIATPMNLNLTRRWVRKLNGGVPFIKLSIGFTGSTINYSQDTAVRSEERDLGLCAAVQGLNEDIGDFNFGVTVNQITERNRFVVVLLQPAMRALVRLTELAGTVDEQRDRIRDMNAYLNRLIEYRS